LAKNVPRGEANNLKEAVQELREKRKVMHSKDPQQRREARQGAAVKSTKKTMCSETKGGGGGCGRGNTPVAQIIQKLKIWGYVEQKGKKFNTLPATRQCEVTLTSIVGRSLK